MRVFRTLNILFFVLPSLLFSGCLSAFEFSKDEQDEIMSTLKERYYSVSSLDTAARPTKGHDDIFASHKCLMDKYTRTLEKKYGLSRARSEIRSGKPCNSVECFKKLANTLFAKWKLTPYLYTENDVYLTRQAYNMPHRISKKKLVSGESGVERVSPLEFFTEEAAAPCLLGETFFEDDDYFNTIFFDNEKIKKRKSYKGLSLWRASNQYEKLLESEGIEIDSLTEAIRFFHDNEKHMNAYPPVRDFLARLANPFHMTLLQLLKIGKAKPVPPTKLESNEKMGLRPIFFHPFYQSELGSFYNGMQRAGIHFTDEGTLLYELRVFMRQVSAVSENELPGVELFSYFFVDTGGYLADYGMEKRRHYQLLWLAVRKDQLLVGMYPRDGMLLVYSVDSNYHKPFIIQLLGLLGLTQEYHVSDIEQGTLYKANPHAKNLLFQKVLKRTFITFVPLDNG